MKKLEIIKIELPPIGGPVRAGDYPSEPIIIGPKNP